MRILVVEDEPLIAMLIEDVISDMNADMIGPIASLEEAMRVASTQDFDCAFLDVNIVGGAVFPVSDVLRDRNIPMVMTTGYLRDGLPARFGDVPVLSKPYTMAELGDMLQHLCRQSS